MYADENRCSFLIVFISIVFCFTSGILNFTEGSFTLDTFYMHENMTYFLKLIAFKGDRVAIATQEMQVASGNPPKMAIA